MNSRFRVQFHTNSNPFNPDNISRSSTSVRHRLRLIFWRNVTIPPLPNQSGTSIDHEALNIQSLLKTHSHAPVEEMEHHLDQSRFSLAEDMILNVLKRLRSEWKPAYTFFNWACKTRALIGISPETSICNEIIDILGRMKRFDHVLQVLDEMSMRENSMNDRTFAIVVSRLSSAHKIKEAIDFFNRVEESTGLDRRFAFQTLLLSLCRYKHVEEAEFLFYNRKTEFGDDIKSWNIILNGWCVSRRLPEAKRFWKAILRSGIKPDKFTYAIFINSLCKLGKTTTAKALLYKMWEEGCAEPDTVTCNTVIDGLCFKKRIPEALALFDAMNNGSNCPPNVATYNSLIKHLCKIRRMEKVNELLNEMEAKGGDCSPNALTYGHLLRGATDPQEVDKILNAMETRGCKMEVDTYNMVLRLFVKWGDEERVKHIWDEMERSGLGPDQRSYTIIIHGLYDEGRIGPALDYFSEMVSKGMVPGASTKALAGDMRSNQMDGTSGRVKGLRNRNDVSKVLRKHGRKSR